MSATEQLRASVIERVEAANGHVLHIIDAVLKAENRYYESDAYKVPDWQKEETLRRLAAYKADPSIAIPWEEIEAELKAEEDK